MKKFFLPSLLLAIILGMLFPYGAAFKFCIPYILGIMLFFNFYAVSFKVSDFFRKELLYYLFFVLLVIPALVFFCTRGFLTPFRIGFFLIAISPSAIAGTITIRFFKGDLKLCIITTVLYNLLAPLTYSLLINLYFGASGITISVVKIFLNLFSLLFIPFFVANAVKKVKKLTPVIQKISGTSAILFPIAVYIAISYSSYKIKALGITELLSVFAVTGLIGLILYSAGLLAGRNIMEKKTLAVGMGQKNTALCIWVGLANFDPLAAIPATFYIIVHHSINTVLLLIFSRLEKKQKEGSGKKEKDSGYPAG